MIQISAQPGSTLSGGREISDLHHVRCNSHLKAVSYPSTPVFLLNASLAIMVLNTAQLNAASPGGTTTKMYVFSVNLARKQLKRGVWTLYNRNPALAAVVLVFR